MPPETWQQKQDRLALREKRLSHLAEAEAELVRLLGRVQYHLHMNNLRGAGPFLSGSTELTEHDFELFPRLWLALRGIKVHKPEWRIPPEMHELRLYHKRVQATREWNRVLNDLAPGAVDAMVVMALEAFRGSKSDSMFGSVVPGKPLRKPMPRKMRLALQAHVGEKNVRRMQQGPVALSMGKSPAELEALCVEVVTVCMEQPDHPALWQFLFQQIHYMTLARLHPQLPTQGEFVAPPLMELYLSHFKLAELLRFSGAISQAQHLRPETKAALEQAQRQAQMSEEEKVEEVRLRLYGRVSSEDAGPEQSGVAQTVADDGKSFWWMDKVCDGIKVWPKRGDPAVADDFFSATATPSDGLPPDYRERRYRQKAGLDPRPGDVGQKTERDSIGSLATLDDHLLSDGLDLDGSDGLRSLGSPVRSKDESAGDDGDGDFEEGDDL